MQSPQKRKNVDLLVCKKPAKKQDNKDESKVNIVTNKENAFIPTPPLDIPRQARCRGCGLEYTFKEENIRRYVAPCLEYLGVMCPTHGCHTKYIVQNIR